MSFVFQSNGVCIKCVENAVMWVRADAMCSDADIDESVMSQLMLLQINSVWCWRPASVRRDSQRSQDIPLAVGDMYRLAACQLGWRRRHGNHPALSCKISSTSVAVAGLDKGRLQEWLSLLN